MGFACTELVVIMRGAEVLQLLVGGLAIVAAIVEGEIPQSGRLSQYMR